MPEEMEKCALPFSFREEPLISGARCVEVLGERSSVMKIRETAPVASTQRVTAPAVSATNTQGAPAVTSERVSLGASANLRKTVGEARTQAASDRNARIRDLSQAVRSGSYKADPRDIAGAMLDTSDLDSQLSDLSKR